MGALDGNIWVCAECRSINNERAKQCYNCRTPRDLAAVDPATIEGTGHGKLRDIALPPFHSPRPYAVLATIFILAIAGLQAVYAVDAASLEIQIGGGVDATDEQTRFLGLVALATLVVGGVALVAWSLWLSRAVTAMPALGLGYPAASGMMAFVENFLPGLNLLRVPAIVRDVVRRVEPGPNRGEALIFAAWMGLLLGFVVPRVGTVVAGLTSEPGQAAVRSSLTILVASTGFVIVGAIFLVALIWWIEERIRRRREAQLAAIDAATAAATLEPADSTEEGVAIPDSTPTIPAAPQATTRWSWGETADSPLAGTIGSAAGWDTEPLPPLEPAQAARTAWVAPAAASSPPSAMAPDAPAPPTAAPQADAPATQAIPDVVTAPQVASHPTPEAGPRRAPQVAPERAPEPAPERTPAPVRPPAIEPQPASPAASSSADSAPHLTIRIVNRGMLQAEMGGDTEPVILEDLTAYGTALANAGGTAEIVIAGNDGMARLIARRAQRILAEAGIEAALPD